LAEKDPMVRAMYGREVGMQGEAPSLQRLSLFAVKKDIMGHNKSSDKVMPPAELEGMDHLAELIKKNKV
jgi:hypothetical protein